MENKKIGAGIIAIDKKTGDILLGKRSFESQSPGTYAPFGGTYEANKDLDTKSTAKREFKEETGADSSIKMSKGPFYVQNSPNLNFYSYIGLLDDKFPVHINKEHVTFGWYPLDYLPSNLHPGFAELIASKKTELEKIIKKFTSNAQLQESNSNDENPEIIFLIGFPGAGKSTYIKSILSKQSNKNFQIVSTDDIFEKLGKQHNMDYDTTFKSFNFNDVESEYYRNIENAVKNKQNIIVDRTNLAKVDRDGVLKRLTSDYKKIAIIFDVDEAELKRRIKQRAITTGKNIPDEAIQRMKDSYVRPSLGEFDEIIEA